MQAIAHKGVVLGAVSAAAILASACAGMPGAEGLASPAGALSVEGAPTLLGTDVAAPRFAWLPSTRQAAYRIQVARSREGLEAGDLVWDSGEVASSANAHVPYGGPSPSSRDRYVWRVQTRSLDGALSAWSAPASWEMGLLQASDWSAQWISGGETQNHVWSDAVVEWDFTLLGEDVEFLFRASPSGKTYGDAYAWKLVTADGAARLDLISRRYDGDARPLVTDDVLATVALDQPLEQDSRHRLQVDMRGDVLTTSLDGARINVAETSAHERGTVGLRTSQRQGVLLHSLSVQPPEGQAVVEAFRNNDNRMSGGTVVSDGLLVGDNAVDTDVVLPIARPAPLIRREFSVDQPVRSARLYVAAGGFPHIEINGEGVNEAIADGFTAYDRRVLYRTLDVTDHIRSGDNAIGVELGRGWYDVIEPNEWYWHDTPWTAPPTVRLQLELTLADGSRQVVETDGDWRWIDGPTRHDSIFSGERYDARLLPSGWSTPEFEDAAWSRANVVQGPAGALDAAEQDPIAVTEVIRPVAVTQPRPDVWVFDFGRIFSGRLRLNVEGPAGQTISLTQHEQLRDDGTVYSHSGLVDVQLQTDRYILSGDGVESWSPRFGYRGFRYVEVRGFPGEPTLESLTGEVMHSDVRTTGEFESANPLLNQIQQAARRTILNNMHGFQTDTPTFEKNGWTGDAHASALGAALNFDVSRVWTKWMADFRDAQAPSGEIPEIVPSTPLYGYEGTPGWDMIGGPTPSWDAATFVIPNDLYAVTGDTRLLEQMYETQKRLVDYTARWFTEDFLYANVANAFLGEYALYQPPMTDEERQAMFAAMAAGGGGGERQPMPGAVDAVATTYFFHMADLLARNARLLGYDEDARRYAALSTEIGEAFNARYWDGDRYRLPGPMGEAYLQYLNVLPVAFGIAPEDRRAAIMQGVSDDIAANGYRLTSMGVFSGRYAMLLLSDFGHVDTAYRVATQTEYPSWGHWLANDVNTMLEGWSLDSRSRNHHYWGSVSSWFYEGLAGIRSAEPGYGRIQIRPAVPADLEWASAWRDTVQGRIGSSWRQQDGTINLTVTIPAGAEAEVWCPGEGGVQADGASPLRREAGHTIYVADGGEHTFVCAR